MKLPAALKWLYTMLVAVLGWTLFRIVSLSETWAYIKVLFGFSRPDFVRYNLSWYLDRRTLFVLLAACLLCVPWRQLLQKRSPKLDRALERTPALICRRLIAVGLLALCFLFISNSTYNPFIYFRF